MWADEWTELTGHEGNAETVMPQNPAGDGQWAEEVGAEVGGRQAGCLAGSDVKVGLEVRVQDVEETVGEAPEEEKNCDYRVAKLY